MSYTLKGFNVIVFTDTEWFDSGRPVIIAKGFWPIPFPTAHIEAAYRQRGFSPRPIRFDLKDKLCVKHYALTIGREIKQAADDFGGRVDVVGTSLGGVAVYYAVKFLDLAQYVRTLVAVGAPFNGTLFASVGQHAPLLNSSAKQIVKGSRLLRDLQEAELAPGPKYISLCGTRDHISPWPTTYVEGALNPHWGFNHLDLMFIGKVHHRIADYLLNE